MQHLYIAYTYMHDYKSLIVLTTNPNKTLTAVENALKDTHTPP